MWTRNRIGGDGCGLGIGLVVDGCGLGNMSGNRVDGAAAA